MRESCCKELDQFFSSTPDSCDPDDGGMYLKNGGFASFAHCPFCGKKIYRFEPEGETWFEAAFRFGNKPLDMPVKVFFQFKDGKPCLAIFGDKHLGVFGQNKGQYTFSNTTHFFTLPKAFFLKENLGVVIGLGADFNGQKLESGIVQLAKSRPWIDPRVSEFIVTLNAPNNTDYPDYLPLRFQFKAGRPVSVEVPEMEILGTVFPEMKMDFILWSDSFFHYQSDDPVPRDHPARSLMIPKDFFAESNMETKLAVYSYLKDVHYRIGTGRVSET